MARTIAAALMVALMIRVTPVLAQEAPGPGTVEVTLFPGGSLFFSHSSGHNESSFHSYSLGGAIGVNFGRVSLEGELASGIGLAQTLVFGPSTYQVATQPLTTLTGTRPPAMISYTSNVIVPIIGGTRHSVVPYVTAGAGAVTLLQRLEVGLDGVDTFLAGNVGGGIKWYMRRGMGVRGDYRFTAVQNKQDASAFFGRDNRFGHRIYGGVVLILGR